MPTKLTFLGAAQNVTGSSYLLETNYTRVLVDCGLYQEREYAERNWGPFPVPPASIHAVLLTHAHLDHCGLLPKLVREGFAGRIYCTSATSEISQIVLLDTAHIQEQDAELKRERHQREGRQGRYPEVPLYTGHDAVACFPLLSTVPYEQPVTVADGVEATFYDAGHVLGSSMVRVDARHNGERQTFLFSGDVGRWGKPILRDPTVFERADYVQVESTYGDKLHRNGEATGETLAEVISSAARAGGNVIIPSFALERSQEVLYWLKKLLAAKRIPHLMAFVDSPMATSVTEVFRHHLDMLDAETRELFHNGSSPFEFPGLRIVRTAEESKAINQIRGTAVIIAGSGMCTGGRIKHHLANNIFRPESTVLFVGYQAEETLGRQIVDGAKEVRILGSAYPVAARIVQLDTLSAHADRDELFRWLSGLREAPRRVFVTHGERDVARSFAGFVRDRTGWDVSVPGYRDEVILG